MLRSKVGIDFNDSGNHGQGIIERRKQKRNRTFFHNAITDKSALINALRAKCNALVLSGELTLEQAAKIVTQKQTSFALSHESNAPHMTKVYTPAKQDQMEHRMLDTKEAKKPELNRAVVIASEDLARAEAFWAKCEEEDRKKAAQKKAGNPKAQAKQTPRGPLTNPVLPSEIRKKIKPAALSHSHS